MNFGFSLTQRAIGNLNRSDTDQEKLSVDMSKNTPHPVTTQICSMGATLLIGAALHPNSATADSSHEILQTNIRVLIEDLGDQDPYKRSIAAEALGEF